MWCLLAEYAKELVWQGSIIRVDLRQKTEFNYCDRAFDLMFFNTGHFDGAIGLIIISGYKAGKIAFVFPAEAQDTVHHYAIRKDWLIDHLHEYLYLDRLNDRIFIKEAESVLPF